MRKLKRPIMKPPRGMYKYSVDGYTFERPSIEELIETVYYYMVQDDNSLDMEQIAAQVENSICEQNKHMPQFERN